MTPLADGAVYIPPDHLPLEVALGLFLTACAVALFIRALLNGSGPYGRNSVSRR
jgi:hypothetical protein